MGLDKRVALGTDELGGAQQGWPAKSQREPLSGHPGEKGRFGPLQPRCCFCRRLTSRRWGWKLPRHPLLKNWIGRYRFTSATRAPRRSARGGGWLRLKSVDQTEAADGR